MRKIFTLATTLLLGCGAFAQQLNNAGFENWTTSGTGTSTPDSWSSWERAIGAPLGLATKDTADKKEGLASIKIKTDSIQAGPSKRLIPGFVHYGTTFYSPPTPMQYFLAPFTGKPDTFAFWYKYAPATGDTALVSLTVANGTTLLLDGGLPLESTAGLWVYQAIPLTADYVAGTVDSIGITFTSSLHEGVQGSVLHVDGIHFGYVGATAISNVNGDVDVQVYPNPVADVLHVATIDALNGSVFNLVDMTGKLVAKSEINGNKTNLNCAGLASGTYFYSILTTTGFAKKGTVSIAR